MFTGLVECIGTVVFLKRSLKAIEIGIDMHGAFDDLELGQSVCTNGVCLTVKRLEKGVFFADVMPETLRCTNFSFLKRNDTVNLERAMSAAGRFGGHIVSGHVDGTGRLLQRLAQGNAQLFWLSAERSLLRYIVPKGSVALEGVSLTVAAVKADSFCVSLIPHTLKGTTLEKRRVGDILNVEVDIIGKYIEHFLAMRSPGEKKENLTAIFLRQNGF